MQNAILFAFHMSGRNFAGTSGELSISTREYIIEEIFLFAIQTGIEK